MPAAPASDPPAPAGGIGNTDVVARLDGDDAAICEAVDEITELAVELDEKT